MFGSNRIKFISIIVVIYMTTALAWWTILLTKKNNEAYQARVEMAKVKFSQEQFQEVSITKQYQDIKREYNSQRLMIFGEAFVFAIMLIAGIWLIYKTIHKEFVLSKQQNNFLLSITHELKTPLASIGLILETFKKRKLSESQASKLSNNALEETKRLENMIENLLVTSRLQAKPVLNVEPINTYQLINEAIAQISSLYPADKIINLVDPKMQMMVDKESFLIVFKNILENAYKYSPNQGEVKIRSFDKNNESIIAFEDQGIGISDNEKKYITQKFYRIGSEETRNTKGTGLGLYLVEQIVLAHQFKLSITDNIPRGTIVNIIIPK